MNLKEFSDYINNDPTLWEYEVQHGILSLCNDINDISYLTVYDKDIDISDCYIENSRNIINE